MNSIATTHIQTRHPPFIPRSCVQKGAIRVPAQRDRAVHLLLISCFGTRLCRQERKMSIQRLVLSIAVVTALMLPLTARPGGAQPGRAAHPSSPGDPATASRVMKNQEDIGAAVGRVYGAAAGQQLTMLLKEHIAIAADLVQAADAGDQPGQQQAKVRWQRNAEQIADVLSEAAMVKQVPDKVVAR
jgi:hypothetical protein